MSSQCINPKRDDSLTFLFNLVLRVFSRYVSQPVLQAAADLPNAGSELGGRREVSPAVSTQPGRGRPMLFHPERPLCFEGNRSYMSLCDTKVKNEPIDVA